MSDAASEPLPASKYLGGWYQFTFKVALFLQLALRGDLHLYPSLLAQAHIETGHFKSNAWGRGAGAFCMWYSPTGTPNANGVYTTTSERPENVAVYTGWNRSWRMVKDRLRWDDRRMVMKRTGQEYRYSVVEAWFGSNASQEKKDKYLRLWEQKVEDLPWYVRWMERVTNPLLWAGLFLLLFAVVYFMLYLRWRAKQPKKRKGG